MALFLSVLQGATEFLPISSSGHLVLAQELFQVGEENLTFDVLVHVGTLFSVLIVFWRQLWNVTRYFFGEGWRIMRQKGFKEAWIAEPRGNLITGIIIATIPTGLMGVLGKDYFERLFESTSTLGWQFMATGVMLAVTLFVGREKEPEDLAGASLQVPGAAPNAQTDNSRRSQIIPLYAAFIIGIMQGVAIVPAISRSGATIAAALLLGLNRQRAWEFSFIISIPAILGALLLHAGDMTSGAQFPLSIALIALAASAISGWICLVLLRKIVRSGAFGYFSIYCFAIGIWAIFKF